jgi:hypothetical protein
LYETVPDIVLQILFEGMKYAMFPSDMEKGAVGGRLVEEQGYEPSDKGLV